MTDFLENEAEVSSGDDEEYSAKERKKIKHMKHVPSDSSEEEEDDEDRIREENKGFINDDDDDEGSGSGSGSGSDSDQDDRKPKRRREDDDDDLDADNLDEDDLDLIEENIGVKIDRKKKFKRLKRVVDEDSDDADDGDGRDQIANELFHGSDDEDRRSTSPAPRDTGATAHEDIGSGGEYEESDEEDFIVDDQGKPIQKSKKKAIFEDEGLEAARDIFGCDFDYGDFEQYDAEGVVDSDEADDEEDEYEEDEDDDDEEAAAIRKEALKRKKEKKKRTLKKTIYDFGLTPEQFGENLRDDYQRYEVDQCHVEPLKEAEAYLSKMCTSPTHVLEGAVRMLGWQLACEPLVRKTVREVYFERARLDVRPTQKGLKLIDEQHPLYALKYIKNKPVHDLHNEQFLKLKTAVDDKLIEIQFCENIEGNKSSSYLDEMKQLYYKDEFSRVVQDWNDLRGRAVEFAYKKIIEDLKRELTERLLSESRNHVLERCCAKLHHWIKVAPYAAGDFADEDEDDWDTSKGFRVLALAYDPDPSQAAFAAVVDVDGDIIEYKRYPNMLKRKDAYDERFAAMKEDDLQKFRDLIMRRRPHVITIGGESKEALMLVEDIKEVVSSLEEQEQFPKINVELLDNTLAILYALSKKGEADFPDFPPLLRQAVSLARRMQDPLLEFSQLCNPDDEILNLRYHPLQDLLNPIELLNHLSIEFVNRTNEVGVDLNLAVAYPYRQNLVQFLCGFGPRKANQLIKQIKQNDHRLENRNQLVLTFHMGPKVYVNIAGFIKIDTAAVGSSDTYIEVLDSTRIHPEAYDWARKMAVDALDCDDEDLNKPAEALEEILDCPEKLSELDLEAFAKELENQGFGLKNTTLYDIRHELNHRYKDFRAPYESPTAEEIFNMLTKESPETLYVGKLVQCTVIRFIHRKPRGDQLDNANPVRNEDSGLWKCPFCMKSDFPELSDVWNHFDAGDCPGQAIGIKVKIDNNIMGFINIKNLSDKPVNNPAERVKKFGLIHARITKIDPERFSVDLTSRTSDLQDKDGTWKPPKDHYYDAEAEEKDMIQNQKKRDKKSRTYHKRVIAHPSFHNIDYKEVDKLLSAMDQGEAIIRPSSKGIDHLTVSWKVTEGVFQHIDVIEQDKQNHFSLGRRLWIGTLEFEDLDEILARYVSPVASNVRQILEYKYYKESVAGSKEKAAEYLKRDKEKNPKAIPYIFSPVKTLPGKFLLSYLPRTKVIHEHVTVLHDGFKFREKHLFPSLASLLKWFKMNFRNITSSGIGAATPGRMSSRTPYMGGTTPSMVGLDTPSMHKSHMLHNISTVASATPYSIATPNSNYSQTPYSNYAQTPYTPSGQTPFMTPYATTPGPSTTPRYGGVTPNPNLASQLLPPPQRSHIAAHYGSATNGAGVTPMPGYGSGAPGYHGSGAPIASHMSHRPPSSRASASMHSRSEQQDWSKAAEAWAKASRSDGRTTPRYSSTDTRRGSGGRSEGGGRTPRYSEGGSRYQPYSQPDYDASRSTPRSVRSTPKTIHSPTNMSIGGDQTPLYDE
ncbi:hypothetical protein HAZT_HAZT009216 [Hyalella azteca]|uniref:Uncharacterized protein n=1 Tax=Hyalella azteca TaxID=294128 RepID=A0A6A0GT01_HYAAZ|nr:hypothetical protein HAZT_HAZT009216 [Hyalella azteca]